MFNPYNDIALAMQPSQRFTPPRQAALIAQAGALLPVWWAAEDDTILAPKAPNQWLSEIKQQHGVHGDIYSGGCVTECAPWGWSHDARSRFIDAGVSPDSLPTDEELTQHRQLSHRRISTQVMDALRQLLPFHLPPNPIEACDETSLWKAIDAMDGTAMVKLPYSTSGRGIVDTTAAQGINQLRHSAQGMIRRQGSLMVEKRLQKVADFAMLYNVSSDGKVSFIGYSLFETAGTTSYSGNRLLPDDDIRIHLAQWVKMEHLLAVEHALEEVLQQMIGPHHSGPLGVDMIVYRSAEGDMLINPCIEVNLRMTMGVVAHHLTQRFYKGTPRWLNITPGNTTNTEKNIIQHLVPPNPHFTFAITENLPYLYAH